MEDNERIKQLEELVEHQRECIDWLKMIVENLSGGVAEYEE